MAAFTIAAALFAVFTKNTTTAILSAGVSGLFASVIYVLLAAPDVAMTEASIGSGLTTFIFFFALKKIREES
ncbi:MAG: DUF4040 domain-containing protein [Deltaproteobacteria bacterium]|nr:DUF4040 domain-containing protein [Deltaproteobacteria bacterium]